MQASACCDDNSVPIMFIRISKRVLPIGVFFCVGSGGSFCTDFMNGIRPKSAPLENKPTCRQKMKASLSIVIPEQADQAFSMPSTPIEREAALLISYIRDIRENYAMRNISFLVDGLERKIGRLFEYKMEDVEKYCHGLQNEEGGILWKLCLALNQMPKETPIPHVTVSAIFNIPETILYPPKKE